MRLLFLHGWTSVPGGRKPTFLKEHGHEVINPKLPDDDFDESVRIAEAEYNQHQPDLIVGSSRGGAVAVNMDSKGTPLVLLCPAWKNWGTSDPQRQRTCGPAAVPIIGTGRVDSVTIALQALEVSAPPHEFLAPRSLPHLGAFLLTAAAFPTPTRFTTECGLKPLSAKTLSVMR